MASNLTTPHWYVISHIPAMAGHKGGRVYLVNCRECGACETLAATAISDEAMRKRLIRQGWTIGHRDGQHICPACHEKRNQPAAPIEPQTPLAPPWEGSFVLEAWNASDELDHAKFLAWFQLQPESRSFGRPMSLDECWQRASSVLREAFLDQHRPNPDLIDVWNSASSEQRTNVSNWILEQFRDRISLLEAWNKAGPEQRHRLLNWLEQSSFVSRKRSLKEVWDSASERERNEILAAYWKTPRNPITEPPTPVNPPIAIAKPLSPPPGTLRKVDLAERLGLNRSTISMYIKQGMPVRSDGLLDLLNVEDWLNERKTKRILNASATSSESAIATGAQWQATWDDEDSIKQLSRELFGEKR